MARVVIPNHPRYYTKKGKVRKSVKLVTIKIPASLIRYHEYARNANGSGHWTHTLTFGPRRPIPVSIMISEYWTHRLNRTSPFEFSHYSGLNFRRSVSDPNSRLSKVIHAIRTVGPATREEINRNVLGMTGTGKGWGSVFWNMMILNKFVTKTRRGRYTVYTLGPRARLIK